MADAATRVVIIGGGFGGLYATRALKRAPADVTLIDRRNFHLFQPLLYQVATGGLSPGEIGSPLRAIVTRHKNTRVLMGDVVEIDVGRRIVRLSDGEVPYDELIVATSEFSTLVRTRAFLITLILMPVLMVASIGLSRAAKDATDTNTRRRGLLFWSTARARSCRA